MTNCMYYWKLVIRYCRIQELDQELMAKDEAFAAGEVLHRGYLRFRV